jgi:L-alanine-DL-glutamate epimerase-like enolase superfamily enzyme
VDGGDVVSHWERLAELPLEVEGYTLEKLEAPRRVTTQFRLAGGGLEGVGEDISSPDEHGHDSLHAAGPYLDLAGAWTLGSFVEHLATVDQWQPEPAQWEMALRWRNWAFESAALDLALRQAGMPLHEALGLELRPVTFVNSLGLGDPPSCDTIDRRLELYPTVGFKLDAAVTWTAAICETLAGTGAVRTVDFKGRYGLEVDTTRLPALYELVLEAFPEALFEDPHEEFEARLPAERVSHDAPIARVEDITTPTINVKPSRIGGVRPLLAIYEHCAAAGVAMYGGGMGELGVGREQIQLLASLFHPDGPNDVAPSAFNLPEPPPGLPPSPLDPGSPPPGFRLTDGPPSRVRARREENAAGGIDRAGA